MYEDHDDSTLAIDEHENETTDGTSNFGSNSTTRTPWLDTVGLLIENKTLTWDNTGKILNCPENDDHFIHALNLISSRTLKNPILSFKKNMGNYQFKKVTSPDIKHLAYTNEYYSRHSRFNKFEMEKLTNLVKSMMKQANDAKKLRNEGRKRDESPSSSTLNFLSKKPRVEEANLLLNFKNESTPQNQNSSFGSAAFNSGSNNTNSFNPNNSGMFSNNGNNIANNNIGNNNNNQMMMQMMMMQMMGDNQQNNFNPQTNHLPQQNNHNALNNNSMNNFMNNPINNSMNPMMNMMMHTMMQTMMQNMQNMQTQMNSLTDLLKQNQLQSNANITTVSPNIPNMGGYQTSNPPQIGIVDETAAQQDKTKSMKPNPHGLFLAIRAKDLGKVSIIVESEKEWWKITDDNNNSPLIAACSHTDSKVFIVSYLIDLVKDPKIVADILTHENQNGLNCYLMAAKTGNIELIKYIQGVLWRCDR